MAAEVNHTEKCKVMHIGHQINTGYQIMNAGKTVQLKTAKEEKDLGIYIVDNTKQSLQGAKASKKAMSVMWLMKRAVQKHRHKRIQLVYKAYIRPHLEHCVQLWSTYLKKDIECLKRVQRRATKLVRILREKSHMRD